MSAELTHEQAADEIEAVALGVATDEISSGATAHAARCAECAAELRSFYHVLTTLSELIPERQLNRGHSAGIKSRLLARTGVGQDGGAGRRQPRAEPARAPELRTPVARPVLIEAEPIRDGQDRRSMPIWIVVATVIAVGSIAALLYSRGARDALPGGSATEPVAADSRVADLERAVAEKDATIASLSGPGVRIIGLYNREAREPLGRMFWDSRRGVWTLFVYSLRQPRPGKIFQVWLGTDEGRIPLGTFQPASNGTGTFRAEHPLRPGSLNAVSISEEDAGGRANAPAGPIILAGALR